MKGSYERLSKELETITILLKNAMGYHVRAITAAERLDAVALSQADGLNKSAKLIKFLDGKVVLNREDKVSVSKVYQQVKDTLNAGASVRDDVRENLVYTFYVI